MGWNLAMQENIDDAMLSRAYSYDVLGSFIAMPIGQLAWGPLGLGVRQRAGARRVGHRVRRHLRARALLALGARPAAGSAATPVAEVTSGTS